MLLLTAIASVVATADLPEVVPGPGLPSLQSLNLTSEALHAMGPIAGTCDDLPRVYQSIVARQNSLLMIESS